ncbi:MAG: efflux RND transporter periplasmic adaptor subunit [Elusimicrobiota bacterium]|nr:efflux RND transporter periplasmic adaptor subunit [Elusimicrobiota bacterium]
MKKKIFIAIPIIAVIVILFFVFRKTAPKIVVQTQISKQNISLGFRLAGEVSARNRIEIKSQFSGRIESIEVEEGQRVTKGQTLVLMSSSERAAMLDAARSTSQKDYERWQAIYRETPIVAPMNGFIILRDKEPGQTVSASDVILAMADDLVVNANVDETDLKYISLLQRVQMYLDAYPDQSFEGIIEHIAYEATVVSNVTVYVIRIKPINPPQVFRSGMTATINIIIDERKDVWAIGVEYVLQINGKNFVTVLKNTNKKNERQTDAPEGKQAHNRSKALPKNFELREVELGLSDGRFVEVVSGLNEDDTIVVLANPAQMQKNRQAPSPMRMR